MTDTEIETLDTQAQDVVAPQDSQAETVADTAAATATNTAAPEWTDEDVEEARLFNWKAPDEWQGDKPPGYIDNPKDYLDRVKRSRIFKVMEDRAQQAETSARETMDRLEHMNQKALERQRTQHEAEIKALRSQRDRAAEDGDMDEYRRLAEREQSMLDAPPTADSLPAEKTPTVDPEAKAYRESEAGQWLNNPVLFNTARQLIDANPAVLAQPAKAQIAYAEAEIRKLYPAYFPAEKKPAPRQVVDQGGLAGTGARTADPFAKLPAEAKAQFERFVKDGTFKNTKEDREEYANEYNRY